MWTLIIRRIWWLRSLFLFSKIRCESGQSAEHVGELFEVTLGLHPDLAKEDHVQYLDQQCPVSRVCLV